MLNYGDIAEAGRGVRLQWRVPHPELLQGFSLLRSNGTVNMKTSLQR
jgi:hypothetical protein